MISSPVISWSSQWLCPPFVRAGHIWHARYSCRLKQNIHFERIHRLFTNVFIPCAYIMWPTLTKGLQSRCMGRSGNNCWSRRLSLFHVSDTHHYWRMSIASLSWPSNCWSRRLSLFHVSDTHHYWRMSMPSLSLPWNCWSIHLSLFHCNLTLIITGECQWRLCLDPQIVGPAVCFYVTSLTLCTAAKCQFRLCLYPEFVGPAVCLYFIVTWHSTLLANVNAVSVLALKLFIQASVFISRHWHSALLPI